MSMMIPIGAVVYELLLVPGWLELDGQRVHGTCDRDHCRIEISAAAPPAKRHATAWHEIAHAMVEELDIHQSGALGEEAVCNLIGLAMAAMDPKLSARIRVYMTTGIMPDDVMILTGCSCLVPIVRLSP